MPARRRWPGLLALGMLLLAGCGDPAPPGPSLRDPGPPGPPLLFELKGPERVFFFGTIHLPHPLVRELPASVLSAHAASDVVLGELGDGEMSSTKALVKQFMPQGKRLGDVVPPAVLERLRAYMKQRGSSSEGLERFKPIWAAITVSLLDVLPLLRQHPSMDQLLQTRAKQAGKEHGGLETLDEQLGLFNGLAFAVQAKFLDRTLADLEQARDRGVDPMDAVILPYHRGDLEALHAEVARAERDEDADLAAFGRRLITARNHSMAERLLARIATQPGRTWFVAVGAGHLGGEEGVLALMAAQGYRARRATRDETFEPAAPQPAAAR